MNKKYKVVILIGVIFIIIASYITYIGPEITKHIIDNSSSQEKKLTKDDMVDYLANHLDECKSEIEKKGYECEIVNEEQGENQIKYLQIKTDDKTKIKFETDSDNQIVYIIRALQGEDSGKEIKIRLMGDIPDKVDAKVSYSGISCSYENANDFNTPKPLARGDEKDRDIGIKNFINTEELNKVRDKAYSAYEELMEIYKERANIE